MEPCQTQVFFEEIYGLLEQIGNQRLVLKDEAITKVTELVKRCRKSSVRWDAVWRRVHTLSRTCIGLSPWVTVICTT
jgi:hypothetical protein